MITILSYMCPQLIILLLVGTVGPTTAFSVSSSSSDVITTSIIHSYTVGNDIIHEVRPRPRDPNENVEEEDEVEMYYPTTRRSFMFPSNNNNCHDNDDDNEHYGRLEVEDKKKDDSRIITIRQTSFGCGKLGATVWPSAIALACLLHGESKDLIKDKKVLELGSGCGLPSAFCSTVARSVLATDYWEIQDDDESISSSETNHLYRNSVDATTNIGDRLVPKNLFGANLLYNIQQSKSDDEDDEEQHTNNNQIQQLDWHDEMGILKIASDYRPDTIIGSDLVYYVSILSIVQAASLAVAFYFFLASFFVHMI